MCNQGIDRGNASGHRELTHFTRRPRPSDLPLRLHTWPPPWCRERDNECGDDKGKMKKIVGRRWRVERMEKVQCADEREDGWGKGRRCEVIRGQRDDVVQSMRQMEGDEGSREAVTLSLPEKAEMRSIILCPFSQTRSRLAPESILHKLARCLELRIGLSIVFKRRAVGPRIPKHFSKTEASRAHRLLLGPFSCVQSYEIFICLVSCWLHSYCGEHVPKSCTQAMSYLTVAALKSQHLTQRQECTEHQATAHNLPVPVPTA